MRRIITLLYIAVVSAALTGNISASFPGEVRWHNETADTTKINRILIDASNLADKTPNELMAYIGMRFEGTPYVAGTLEGDPEMLTVNLDEMDCTTFVETVSAMVLTIKERRNSWQDFLYNLEQLRYRQGRINGYASRLHYISDWIVDNTHRGNLRDITDRLPGAKYQVKTIDYMSRHRDSYPAMKDDATFEGIKNSEVGYRSHRYPYIRRSALMTKNIKYNNKISEPY